MSERRHVRRRGQGILLRVHRRLLRGVLSVRHVHVDRDADGNGNQHCDCDYDCNGHAHPHQIIDHQTTRDIGIVARTHTHIQPQALIPPHDSSGPSDIDSSCVTSLLVFSRSGWIFVCTSACQVKVGVGVIFSLTFTFGVGLGVGVKVGVCVIFSLTFTFGVGIFFRVGVISRRVDCRLLHSLNRNCALCAKCRASHFIDIHSIFRTNRAYDVLCAVVVRHIYRHCKGFHNLLSTAVHIEPVCGRTQSRHQNRLCQCQPSDIPSSIRGRLQKCDCIRRQQGTCQERTGVSQAEGDSDLNRRIRRRRDSAVHSGRDHPRGCVLRCGYGRRRRNRHSWRRSSRRSACRSGCDCRGARSLDHGHRIIAPARPGRRRRRRRRNK
eukprot:Opistho-2@27554